MMGKPYFFNAANSLGDQTRSESVCASSSSGSQEDKELICPICMEAWTNVGEHQLCCLPCGHLYGFSCINKWLQHRSTSAKCPQCNKTCSVNNIVKIYATKLAAVDDEAQKKILFLEDKLSKETQRRETETDQLRLEVNNLKKMIYQERYGQVGSCFFRHERDVLVNGGRIFDIDVGRQALLLARRLSGIGGNFVLTQMSLNTGEINDDMLLPCTITAVNDLRVSPHNNGLAVFGSRGKKLPVISLDSHNIVMSYNHLPAAPLSCSWDGNSCNHVYAGLQNGMILVFDMRQTRGPLISLTGLSTNPVHSIHQLSSNSTPTSDVRALLSASSMGLCQWNISGSVEGPSLVSDTRNSGLCIASSYCPRSNHVVATYRKKVEVSDDTVPTQTDVGNSKGVEGFHVCFKRRGDDNYQKLSSTQTFVDHICLQRTTFIDFGDERTQLFASCDKSTHELFLQEPSVFAVSQRFPLSSHHLQDVKYAHLNGSDLLCLLTDDRLQLLRNNSP